MHASSSTSELRRIDETLWELPASARPDMRVPARVFASEAILEEIRRDLSLEQLANVATLPGIVDAAYAMPDIHQGYGFPVGGLAATELPDGVVSPGGVGYDINCGVRLLALPLTEAELGERREPLVHELSRAIPAGAGKHSGRGTAPELERVLRDGASAVGEERDVEATESRGRLEGADPGAVSDRAKERGRGQLGTMGSGNHFVELERVERVLDPGAAARMGLAENQLTVLIHSGSRGLGHQVCTDFVRRMDAALPRYGIRLPDRQLSCAPASSPEGEAYLAAMAAAANFAWANRQELANRVRAAIGRVLGRETADGTGQVYDVAHNVAKRERHGGRDVLVHRKGATRAFPGQPVFIPGSMGTASFVLEGLPGALERSFGTTCHGAGRRMSRTGARKRIGGAELRRELEARGIVVRCPSNKGLAEEAPFAYKDVDDVVEVVERAGLARRVARLVPLGVVKG
ncbi:MAG TPA: RtcB family protein [Gaiellaceae bacterium]|nr:RtcB family protein [Gaiellaceae bacterium]